MHVDQASRLGFLYLQDNSTVESTIKGKEAFKCFTMNHGVVILAYHADNGIFKAERWIEYCYKHKYTMNFTAVGSHCQNSTAKCYIR